jgi:hypothetical protein
LRQRAIQEAEKWQDGSLAVEYMWHGMYTGAIEPSWLLQREVFADPEIPPHLLSGLCRSYLPQEAIGLFFLICTILQPERYQFWLSRASSSRKMARSMIRWEQVFCLQFKIESEYYTMQQVEYRPQPDQQANRGGAPRSQVILIVALLLFSVAGLASGFSVGALTAKTSKKTQSTQITNIVPPQKGQGITPTPKPTVKVIPLGCPQSTPGSSIYQGLSQVPDGATSYTFIAQAQNQAGGKCSAQTNQPIHAAGITFKLWLIKHVPTGKVFNFTQNEINNILPHVDQLGQTLEGKVDDKDSPELANELQFSTQQVQQSNKQGQVTWNYKINPDLKEGKYTLVVLDNWQGKAYNWSWYDLVIKKQG